LEAAQMVVAAAQRSQPRAGHLEVAAHLVELLGAVAAKQQKRGLRARRLHIGARARTRLHHAGGPQRAESLPYHRPADAEAPGELVLAGELGPRFQTARTDQLEQLVTNQVGGSDPGRYL